MGHCTIAPQPLLHRNHLPRKKVELSTEKLWVHKNTKPWPPRLSVKAQRRERPPSTSACWEWEWKKKKKKKGWKLGARVLCTCVSAWEGEGERETLLVEFITRGFVVGLLSKKKRIECRVWKRKEDLPRSEDARGIVAVRGIVSEPSLYLYTPALWHSISENPKGCSCVHTTSCVVAGQGSLIPF